MSINHASARSVRTQRALVLCVGLGLALPVLFGLQAADPARAAAPFTVNQTGDQDDLDFPGGAFDGSSDDVCDADSSTAGKQCTLRAAIQQANKSSGADAIAFNIPGSGMHTISPGSQLPVINRPVTIDGYTQPGASENTLAVGNDAVIQIELSGENAGAFASGLQISSADCTIKGLRINRFTEGVIIPADATGNKVQGNIIGGLDASGTQSLGNDGGVLIAGAPDNTVGGTTPGARNIISENGFYGVAILGAGATGNRILGNSINDNDNNGVVILADAKGNRILSNFIFSNGDLGIALDGGTEDTFGVTANDPKDPDTGPNRLQNYPVITSATNLPKFTSVNGTLNSTPGTKKKTRTFIIQFFSNTSADSSGFGEGKTFIGQTQVTTNRQGKASFGFSPAAKVPVGDFITATATRKDTGDTSEFSRARIVEEPVIGP